ncbi:MAG: sugar phosphate isomerase/epimerase family protein [Phycisphaerales bacterium]
MFKPAFSTIACPEWTLDRVLRCAREWGYDGVELRSFGHGGGGTDGIASDPGLTAGSKARYLADDAGVSIAAVSGSVSFDAPITPPVLGRVMPWNEASVRAGRDLVEVGHECGASMVRVFGFRVPKGQSRTGTLRRIIERLGKVVDHARGRDLVVVLENGGSFSTAEDLLEIIGRVGSPLLRASYDILAATDAGEDPAEGLMKLGARAALARVRDVDSDRRPVPLGTGTLACAEFCSAASALGCWLSCTWDVAWMRDLADAESVLPKAIERMYGWAGDGGSVGSGSAGGGHGAAA